MNDILFGNSNRPVIKNYPNVISKQEKAETSLQLLQSH